MKLGIDHGEHDEVDGDPERRVSPVCVILTGSLLRSYRHSDDNCREMRRQG